MTSPPGSPVLPAEAKDEEGGEEACKVTTDAVSDWDFFFMLAVVALIGFNEAYQCFMVERFGVPEEHNATYVGILASAFFASQLCSSVLWGIASDRFGRRPCLLAGVALNGLAMVQFGFADTFPKAVLGRVLAGGLSGNVGITKTYMGEVATGARAARAFSVLGLVWGAGSILAPIVGGYMSNPTSKYPSVFPPESNPVLVHYPYLLPSLTSTVVAAVAVVLGWLYLPETPAFLAAQGDMPPCTLASMCKCKSKRGQYSPLSVTQGAEVELPSVGEEGAGAPVVHPVPEPPTGCCSRARSLPQETLAAIACYAGVAMTQVLFDELMPVMTKTAAASGGLGFTSSQVGLVLTVQGVVLVVYQVFFYQRAVTWLGPVRLFTLSAAAIVPVTLAWPFTTLAAEDPVVLWASISCLMALKSTAFANLFTSVMMLINTSARGRAPLGAVNGVAQSASAGVRTAAPFLGGLLFSSSHALKWRLHALVAYVLPGVTMAATAALASTLPKWLDEGLGKNEQAPDTKQSGEGNVMSQVVQAEGATAQGSTAGEREDAGLLNHAEV